jgi:membrane protein required for colicin V production
MFFDALVILVVVLAAGLGASKGFTRQVAGLLAPVVGIAGGWPLSAEFPALNRWLAFALLYLLFTLVLFLFASFIRRDLERAGLKGLDNHLGFWLGAAKGCVLAVGLTLIAVAIWSDLRGRVLSSQTGGLMVQAIRGLRPLLPPAASGVLGPWFDLLDAIQRRNA